LGLFAPVEITARIYLDQEENDTVEQLSKAHEMCAPSSDSKKKGAAGSWGRAGRANPVWGRGGVGT